MHLTLLPLALFATLSLPSLAQTTPHRHPSNKTWHFHPPAHGTFETPHYPFHDLYKLTERFFDNFLYPANQAQTLSINSTLFAPNTLGRVDVSRTFNGQELNTEYIFGLFSALRLNPDYFSLLGLPTGYNFIHLTANQNIVSVAVVIDFEFRLIGVTAPVELDVWLTFNANGEISQYDATFRRLDWQIDTLLVVAQKLLGANSTTAAVAGLQGLIAKSVCRTEALYCNGTDSQYAGFDECFAYLTERVRYGKSYELGMDTLLCRMIHQNMVPFRPDVHCRHIGPTGGGFCNDDLTYAGVVTESIYRNSPFVPYGYQNVNETIAEE